MATLLLRLLLSCPFGCLFRSPLTDVMSFVAHGRWPLEHSKRGLAAKGMTRAQVKAALGELHTQNTLRGTEKWVYCFDSLGVSLLLIDFDNNGIAIAVRQD